LSGVNVIVTAPLSYGRLVPTFVAVPIIGAYGAKKSLAPWLILPACFDIYIFSLNPNYAERSPKTSHPLDIFIAVTTELVVLNLSPGVPTTPLVDSNFAPVDDAW